MDSSINLRPCLRRTMICLWLGIWLPIAVCGDDPPIADTQDPRDVSLTPQQSLLEISVPSGFRVTLFAGEPAIRRPIAFDFDDRGRLWVAENYSHPHWHAGEGVDRIIILEDVNGDGEFDERKVFWDQGRYLSALVVGHGGVWIGNTPELAFIPDRDGNDVPDGPPVVKLDGFQLGNKNNCLNNFHWGPDGWLYGAVGLADTSLVGPPDAKPRDRKAITRCMWRYHPAKGTFEVLAQGMVNPWGADFNQYGDLFTSNTVIGHLWHIVPGMYCQRRGFERDNPYAYTRIQSIADHLHWGGGRWQASRQSEVHHDDAGGGHAHCGGMVYLGDNFPPAYRGTFFTGNLHGLRLNNERLTPRGSSYVATHRPDFLRTTDRWFRSLTQKYGPDGGVFVSDWHDLGECHDKDGSHRSSGRIYKVVYGQAQSARANLPSMTEEQLVDLHEHKNEWFVRHARRILHERHVAGRKQSMAATMLRRYLDDRMTTELRLKALWSLFVMDQLTEDELIRLTSDKDLHIRRWSIRLLVDELPVSREAMSAISARASDESAPVRLAVASALQRFPTESRWAALDSLVDHNDSGDSYLPAMIWYALEPLVVDNPRRSLDLTENSQIPLLQRFVARRLVEARPPNTQAIVDFVLAHRDLSLRREMVRGMVEGTTDRTLQPPARWMELYRQLQNSQHQQLWFHGAQLAARFGDRQAIQSLEAAAANDELGLVQRRASLTAILQHGTKPPLQLLHQLLTTSTPMRADALVALERCATTASARLVLQQYNQFNPQEKGLAVAALVANRATARILLDAVAAGGVPQRDVSAYDLQRLNTFKDDKLKAVVDSIWPPKSRLVKKSQQIAHYKTMLTDAVLESGDASAGRVLFEQTCAKCHQLFGEGSTLAPDLTGSGRRNLDYLLSNLVDPNGLIDPAYRLTTAITAEGRALQGFILQLTEQVVVMRTQSGQVSLDLNAVTDLETSSISMMPEGLLQTYSDDQVRDLIKYLMSSEQVPLK